jgi:uncharacterized protein
MPAGYNTVEVRLGWPREGSFLVFSGNLADVESFGQKRGGRTLMIMARGVNLSSKTKQQVKWSLGDGTTDEPLSGAMQKAAEMGGMTVKVDQALGSLTRKYWMANNESFMEFGQRMAGEVGGIFKISGTSASLTKAGSFSNADGDVLFNVSATAGVNLIAWKICPQVARRNGQARASNISIRRKLLGRCRPPRSPGRRGYSRPLQLSWKEDPPRTPTPPSSKLRQTPSSPRGCAAPAGW